MKKLKLFIAAFAVIAISGAAVASTNSGKAAPSTKKALDCWPTQALVGAPSIDQQAECPGGTVQCCYKPRPGGGTPLQFNKVNL